MLDALGAIRPRAVRCTSSRRRASRRRSSRRRRSATNAAIGVFAVPLRYEACQPLRKPRRLSADGFGGGGRAGQRLVLRLGRRERDVLRGPAVVPAGARARSPPRRPPAARRAGGRGARRHLRPGFHAPGRASNAGGSGVIRWRAPRSEPGSPGAGRRGTPRSPSCPSAPERRSAIRRAVSSTASGARASVFATRAAVRPGGRGARPRRRSTAASRSSASSCTSPMRRASRRRSARR